jgi:hypothetical protein
MITMNVVVVLIWYIFSEFSRVRTLIWSRATWLRKSHPDFINVATLIVDCVSVAVAFIPDGLPIAVTARYLGSKRKSVTDASKPYYYCANNEAEQHPLQEFENSRDAWIS